MAEETGQERTEQATPKKQQEAREKGQVVRSRELSTMMVLLASAGGVFWFGAGLVESLSDVFRTALTPDRAALFEPRHSVEMLTAAVMKGLGEAVPFLILTLVVALIAPALLGGWTFSPAALVIKLDRLDPVRGLSRVFGWMGVIEAVKAVGKFVVVAVAGYFVVAGLFDELLMLSHEPVKQGIAHVGQMVVWAFVTVSVAMIVIVFIDIPFQIWNYNKQMRMTKQEVKQELRDTDGKPEVKTRVRRLQIEMAQRRMMAEVPRADVIVTNPTHFAVALRYDQARMKAPVLVAKGKALIAQEIIRIGRECKVPVMSAPPLARAIYYSTELDQEIPEGLYKAVAQVLAYVYQLKRRRRGWESPVVMDDLPIPEEYRRDG